MTLIPSAAAASVARAGKRSGQSVASNVKACSGRCDTVTVSPSSITAAPAWTSASMTTVSACLERVGRWRTVTWPATAPATSSRAAALQSLSDIDLGGVIALSAGDIEFAVILVQDLDAELPGRVDGHIQIGGGNRSDDVNRGLLAGQRKRQQQAGGKLRGDRPVDGHFTAPERAADLDGEKASAVADTHAELTQRLDHRKHRPVQQGSLPLDAHRGVAERGDGGEKACGQPRFSDIESVGRGVQSPFDD